MVHFYCSFMSHNGPGRHAHPKVHNISDLLGRCCIQNTSSRVYVGPLLCVFVQAYVDPLELVDPLPLRKDFIFTPGVLPPLLMFLVSLRDLSSTRMITYVTRFRGIPSAHFDGLLYTHQPAQRFRGWGADESDWVQSHLLLCFFCNKGFSVLPLSFCQLDLQRGAWRVWGRSHEYK